MVRAVAEAVSADNGQFSVFRNIKRLGDLRREDLRPLFRAQITHPDYGRRAQAIRALGQLPKDETVIRTLRGLVNDQEPYAAVRAAVSTLGNWDAPANRDVFQKATKLTSPLDGVRLLALDALTKADAAEGKAPGDPCPQTTQTVMRYLSDRAHGVKASPVMAAQQRVLSATDTKGNAEFATSLRDLQSFVPFACENVEARGIEEKGERISRVAFYRMVTGQQVLYLRFSLTAEGKVVSANPFDVLTE